MTTFKKTSLIFPLIASIIAAWLGNKIAYQVRTDHEAGVGPSDLINNSVNDVVSNPLHVSFVQADLIVALVCALLVWLTWAYQATTRRKWRDGHEHGSAEWGTSGDIRPYINKKARENMVFTRTERLNLDGRVTQRNLNALVIGSSGSGKSRYYVLPNLYQANTSFIVTDPKGELLRASGTMLEEEGYKIRPTSTHKPLKRTARSSRTTSLPTPTGASRLRARTFGKKPSTRCSMPSLPTFISRKAPRAASLTLSIFFHACEQPKRAKRAAKSMKLMLFSRQ